MDFHLQAMLVVIIVIFISLLAIAAGILAFINWYTLRKTLRQFPDIPEQLYQPLTAEEQILMRSWYTKRSGTFCYQGKMLLCDSSGTLTVKSLPAGNNTALPYKGPEPVCPVFGHGDDEKPVPRITRAICNPDDAVREANRRVNEAIVQFCEEEDEKDDLVSDTDLPDTLNK